GQPRPRDGNGDGNSSCDIGAFEAAGPDPVVCQPRPPVRVSLDPGQPGTLRATVQASTNPTGSANHLRELRFGQMTNATVDIAGQIGLGSDRTVSVPPGTGSISFVVRRGPNGSVGTVPVTVVDECGSWQTLVGGGRDAWVGQGSGATAPTPVTRPAASP